MTYLYPYPRPDPSEMDADLVRLGFISEEERISRGYQRIHAEQMKRRFFKLEPRT